MKKMENDIYLMENVHSEQIKKLKEELNNNNNNSNSDLIPEMIPPEQTYNIFFCKYLIIIHLYT